MPQNMQKCTPHPSPTPMHSGTNMASGLTGSSLFQSLKNVSYAHPNVSIKWFEDGTLNVCGQLHRPPSGNPRRPDRDHLGRRQTPKTASTSPIAKCTRRSVKWPTSKGPGRQQRRPRRALHADDSRGRLCHAGLCPDRRHAFDCLCRLLTRSTGCARSMAVKLPCGDGRRSPPRRAQHCVEIKCRQSPGHLRRCCRRWLSNAPAPMSE